MLVDGITSWHTEKTYELKISKCSWLHLQLELASELLLDLNYSSVTSRTFIVSIKATSTYLVSHK